MKRPIALLPLFVALLPGAALAHATEGGVVLLLPTGLYIAGGVAAVVLTVLLLSVLPDRAAIGLFRPLPLIRSRGARPWSWVSVAGAVVLAALVVLGLLGEHNPMHNPLSLAVWSLFWIVLVLGQGIWGDLWRWINPWHGPYTLLARRLGWRRILRLPGWLGYLPALVSFLAFAAVLLAHPAPADPERLAAMVACYWAAHFALTLVFGPKWLRRGEGISVLMSAYARIAPLGKARGRWRLGLWGWKAMARRAPPVGLAVFMIVLLAVGSYDGLNETYWWFGQIGLNPLEFPGRSAVVKENLLGVAGAVVALPLVFAAAIALGLALAGEIGRFAAAFLALAPALLPIALGYHFAHYLPSILLEGQYMLAVANDPLDSGLHLLGLDAFRVTTGFFNTTDTVRVIFLAQAGAVVLGHAVAIALSHALAARMFGSGRKAALSQAPLALFMVGYTLFGLWLLASPRGV
ncbi:hypothetical protein Ga0609869_002443 [Rhodovulum iodosum]|uniref:Fenitrothion hydrolase n=1 Tax=Rhodovulum iodosum TaxID=68291 RepID=A0ABV3XUT7_9RHOB|nr:hypothetical protein [Rhodovulum robiginosum]RSK35130.1 hypothetical protein EJA01_06970 [Rhodovulum robiginosum]